MDVNDKLRKKLINLREEHSWTQKEVAARLNISQRTYSHYENGNRRVSVEMLVNIAKMYDVSISDLIEEQKPDY